MRFIKEFKEFAIKGNVIDLAIAVIIGGAFGKIVTSLVSDIIMPLVGVLLGGVSFADIKIKLSANAFLNIGNFIQSIVDFVIISASIFIAVKVITRLKKKFEDESSEAQAIAPAPVPTKSEVLLEEIRDLLKK
jgi:large conductance mechanosensitive channel